MHILHCANILRNPPCLLFLPPIVSLVVPSNFPKKKLKYESNELTHHFSCRCSFPPAVILTFFLLDFCPPEQPSPNHLHQEGLQR